MSPTHGGGVPSPMTSGGGGFLPHISGDVPSPTYGDDIPSPTPNNGIPFRWTPPGATDEPPLDIRWGLLHDAQTIRICMHLSMIWPLFSSKIIFINCVVINIWIQAILSLALLGLKKNLNCKSAVHMHPNFCHVYASSKIELFHLAGISTIFLSFSLIFILFTCI